MARSLEEGGPGWRTEEERRKGKGGQQGEEGEANGITILWEEH